MTDCEARRSRLPENSACRVQHVYANKSGKIISDITRTSDCGDVETCTFGKRLLASTCGTDCAECAVCLAETFAVCCWHKDSCRVLILLMDSAVFGHGWWASVGTESLNVP